MWDNWARVKSCSLPADLRLRPADDVVLSCISSASFFTFRSITGNSVKKAVTPKKKKKKLKLPYSYFPSLSNVRAFSLFFCFYIFKFFMVKVLFILLINWQFKLFFPFWLGAWYFGFSSRLRAHWKCFRIEIERITATSPFTQIKWISRVTGFFLALIFAFWAGL